MKNIAFLLDLILALALLGCATPTEALSTAPEDIIPLAVPEFTLVERGFPAPSAFEGEEYAAYSFFIPVGNSEFQNKVATLEIWARLFKDETSATKVFEAFTTGATEIQVQGVNTILAYDEHFGSTWAVQQRGRLLIYSNSLPPFEATFDEEILKDAAIQGIKAIRF